MTGTYLRQHNFLFLGHRLNLLVFPDSQCRCQHVAMARRHPN
jgi:hypothetical protein